MKFKDPDWPTAAQWLAGEFSRTSPASLAVLGVPLNCSITPGSCDLAPAAIRNALERYSLNDVDAAANVANLEDLAVKDCGDLEFTPPLSDEALERALGLIREATADAKATVLLGGDNGVTRIGVNALSFPLTDCGLLTFDAHHDVRTLDGGLNNANPVRALLEDGLPGKNIVQIGIQPFTNSPVYSAFAREAGITVITAGEVFSQGIETIVSRALAYLAPNTEAVYVDLDLDVLDRAYAPACPGSRPGGLHPWMLRRAMRICGKAPLVRTLDIVEIDPTADVADASSLAAASFLLAFASGLTHRLKS